MPLNPSAAEFKPSSKPISIPLPDDPWAQESGDVAMSPEDALELEEVQSWVEMMADFEESEGDHLIALAMRYADKHRIQDAKQRAFQAGLVPSKAHGHRHKH